jgi:hypothetical protein
MKDRTGEKEWYAMDTFVGWNNGDYVTRHRNAVQYGFRERPSQDMCEKWGYSETNEGERPLENSK